MARRVLAWECRYCGALKKNENICVRHELSCLENPEAKNCYFCIHSLKSKLNFDLRPEPGLENIQITKTKEVFHCSKRDCACSRAISANCEYFKRKNGNV